jgi:hypothetical protein
MMERRNDGGYAFPQTFVVDGPAIDPVTGANVPDGCKHGHHFPGMTLRDYFAAKAMQALMDQGIGANARAAAAYREADAMLAERAK